MSTLQENLSYTVRSIEDVVCNFVKSENSHKLTIVNEDNHLSGKGFSSSVKTVSDKSVLHAKDVESNSSCPVSQVKKEHLIPIEGRFIDPVPATEARDSSNVVLRKPNKFNNKSKRSTKIICDFLKSLDFLCDLCDTNTQRVIKLNNHERIFAAGILKKSRNLGIKKKRCFSSRIPQQTCGRCFSKIYFYRNHLKTSIVKAGADEKHKKTMTDGSHGFQCQCSSCQSHYGALPVLLKGIEEQDKIQSSQMRVSAQSSVYPTSHMQSNFQQMQDVTMPHGHMEVSFPEPHQAPIKYESKTDSFLQQSSYDKPQYYSQLDTSFQMPQLGSSQVDFPMPTKTEPFISQPLVDYDFDESKSNVTAQGQFDIHFRSDYFDPSSSSFTENVKQTLDPSTSSKEDEKNFLPTLLSDLESHDQVDLLNQPSTSKGFQSQSLEDKHSRRIMVCGHCDKKFTHKGDFNKHLRKHTKERPYKCSFCDKTFSHTSNLHRHERIHSGDKPYKCEFCDKSFNRKDKLESHKNSKFCKNRRSWK